MDNVFRWCNYDWSCKMEGGRIIHASYPYTWYSNSNDVITRLRNGEMHLSYRNNPQEITYWDGTKFYPTIERALIRTKQHFDYGSFSIEAMMPKGINVQCAFWLSGFGNWPPEIDICEAWSDNCNYLHRFTNHFPWFGKSWRTTYNVHYNNKKLKHKHLGSKNVRCKQQPLDPTENWIKYECEWLPDEIVFRANDTTTKVIKSKYANMLVENLRKKENGHLMDVILDINIDDPKYTPNRLDSPFKVRNFKYEPYD